MTRQIVLASQVMVEFVHVVTDGRRFEYPLGITAALDKAQEWWEARETEQVSPTLESMDYCWKWMKQHDLGRKRLLDTMLTVILSSNARDFNTFGCFQVIGSN
jgi:hypothetical protein